MLHARDLQDTSRDTHARSAGRRSPEGGEHPREILLGDLHAENVAVGTRRGRAHLVRVAPAIDDAVVRTLRLAEEAESRPGPAGRFEHEWRAHGAARALTTDSRLARSAAVSVSIESVPFPFPRRRSPSCGVPILAASLGGPRGNWERRCIGATPGLPAADRAASIQVLRKGSARHEHAQRARSGRRESQSTARCVCESRLDVSAVSSPADSSPSVQPSALRHRVDVSSNRAASTPWRSPTPSSFKV